MNNLIATLSAHLILHSMTPGRALHALKNIRRNATPDEAQALAPLLDGVESQARRLARMLRAWRTSRKLGSGRPGVMAIDAQVDGILAAIAELLARLVKNLRPGPLRKGAAELIELHFPDGPGAVIHQPLDDELEAAEAVLETLQAADRQDAVRDLGLGIWRDALADVLPEYDLAIRQHRGQPLQYADIRQERTELHGHMSALFITVLARSLGDAGAYERLARPIIDQHEALAAAYRNRTRPKDVDENTGNETDALPEDGEG